MDGERWAHRLPYAVDITGTEERIILRWFSGETVVADPGREDLVNGRHRLWNTIPHAAGRLLPLQGDGIRYTTADMPASSLRECLVLL